MRYNERLHRAPESVPNHSLLLLGDKILIIKISDQPVHMPVSLFKLLKNTAKSKGNTYDLNIRPIFKSFAAFLKKCYWKMIRQW